MAIFIFGFLVARRIPLISRSSMMFSVVKLIYCVYIAT